MSVQLLVAPDSAVVGWSDQVQSNGSGILFAGTFYRAGLGFTLSDPPSEKPADFAPGRYRLVNGALQRNAVDLDRTDDLRNALVAAGVAATSVDTAGNVTPSNLQTAAQPIIDAYTSGNVVVLANYRERSKAKIRLLSDNDADAKVERAVMSSLNDAVNQTNARFNSLLAAIAAATALSDLKTRAAAINNLPIRTLTDVRDAILQRIDDGTVD